jgi:hypothetical protein
MVHRKVILVLIVQHMDHFDAQRHTCVLPDRITVIVLRDDYDSARDSFLRPLCRYVNLQEKQRQLFCRSKMGTASDASSFDALAPHGMTCELSTVSVALMAPASCTRASTSTWELSPSQMLCTTDMTDHAAAGPQRTAACPVCSGHAKHDIPGRVQDESLQKAQVPCVS